MIAVETTWSKLHVGGYMRDKNGKAWKIVKEREFHFLIQDREGNKHHLQPKPDGTPVTMLVPTEDEANGTLQRLLGAVEMGRKEQGEGVWSVPAYRTARDLTELKSHLKLFHGIWADDVKTMESALEAHTEGHEDTSLGTFVNHQHASS